MVITVQEYRVSVSCCHCSQSPAKALGYDQPHKAVLAHCRKVKLLIDIDGINHTVQQNQSLTQIDIKSKLIPESDVYRLVMRSKLDSAESFQDWVVEEVTPIFE